MLLWHRRLVSRLQMRSRVHSPRCSEEGAMARMSKKHTGIPRTYKIAHELGHKTVRVAFDDLSDELKGQFVQLSEHGARAGSICGFGPSPTPGYLYVCYKDDRGRCKWKEVKKEEVQTHA